MQQQARLELIDSLRGYALLGLFLVHCVEMFELYWANPVGGPVVEWTFGLFAGKSFALFALCFGISFYIIMERAKQRGVDFTRRFAWRLIILFLFGLAHQIVYRGDILTVLALVGLLLIPLDKVRNDRLLLMLAFVVLLQIPLFVRAWAALQGAGWANHPFLFSLDQSLPVLMDGSFIEATAINMGAGTIQKWSFYAETGRVFEIAGLFMVGLVLGRSGFFQDPDRFVAKRRLYLAIASIVWLALHFATPHILEAVPQSDVHPMGQSNVSWALGSWSALAAMTFQVIVFVEIYQAFGRRILGSLAAVGRMTLTLYIGQSVLFVPIFYGWGLGLHDDMSLVQAVLLGIATFGLQMLFAALWFRRFHYGPLEWLWRALTRTTTDIPFVRRDPATA